MASSRCVRPGLVVPALCVGAGSAVAGVILGFAAPEFAQHSKPLGTGFRHAREDDDSAIIFTTLVLGVGSVVSPRRSDASAA